MYYYTFHIGDYRSATAHLTNEEDLAYRRLMDMYYDTELPIPDDLTWVARRIRVSVDVVKAVLQDMFVLSDEGWKNERCAEEIKAYKRMGEGGRKGAAKRWGKGSDNPPITTPLQPQCQPITNNQEPITKNQSKSIRANALCPQDVDPNVWEDWKQLRKSKRATVSETVVEQARKEATKAGMSLNSFLKEWCLRGSQGLKAEWIKEKPQSGQQLTAYQQSVKSAGISIFGNLEEHYAERNITPVAGRLGSEDI